MGEVEAFDDAPDGLFSNAEAGRFTPLSISIKGLSGNQAAWVPAERFNFIWGVVNHAYYWQEFMLLRLDGERIDREALGGKDG
jgi:hypothetical protein